MPSPSSSNASSSASSSRSSPSATDVARPPPNDFGVETQQATDLAFEYFLGLPTPPSSISAADFKSPFTLPFVTQDFFETEDLTTPPSAGTRPSRFHLLRIWAAAVLINKAEHLWPLFIALRDNTHFDFPTILRHAGPDNLELSLLRCLALQPYGPPFILDWLLLFQSSIEELIVRDKKLRFYHPQAWQWFGHANTYANLRIRYADPAADLPLPKMDIEPDS
ncbi:hypothetical protein MPER_12851 [Moniliophthora perniciosa FA553]|nr:hypothetical protein MPER_12851 [Moniliophthora perniciosa FA553]